eukprot:6209454-Pleurochrysis_carterae.AAC.5
MQSWGTSFQQSQLATFDKRDAIPLHNIGGLPARALQLLQNQHDAAQHASNGNDLPLGNDLDK